MAAPIAVLPTAFLSGIVIHMGLFIRGEWHLYGYLILLAHLVAFCLLLTFSAYLSFPSTPIILSPQELLPAFQATLKTVIAYLFGLLTSISTYRLFFHPLRQFPGPLHLRLTKFAHAFHTRTGQNHIYIQHLHETAKEKGWGEIVRTGPNEVTVFDVPGLYQSIDGFGKEGMGKTNYYDIQWPTLSVVTMRDRKLHDERRRVWDRAFARDAYLRYEPIVHSHVTALTTLVSDHALSGKPVDLSEVFYWFSWDVMGALTFSTSFNMLRDRRPHAAVQGLRRSMSLVGQITPVPWLGLLAFKLSPAVGTVGDYLRTTRWCHEQMDVRKNLQVEKPDISSHFIAEATAHGWRDWDKRWFYGDAVTAVVAGSDTTSSTLINAFYRLAQDPARQAKLHAELAAPGADCRDTRVLAGAPYLNGFINEVLRLHPVLLTNGMRETPLQGATIGGRYIPGGVTVVAPRCVTGQLESCFAQPHDFIPERWTSRPDLVRDKRVHVPFSNGRYGCAGKQLGLMELRLVIAALVTRFEVGFVDGDDGEAMIRDTKDNFTTAPGKLSLVFRERE